MSSLLEGVLTILAHRSAAAAQREIKAKGTYARFMLESPSEEDSPGVVVAAADELGIGIPEICRDLVTMKMAQGCAAQIEQNDQAIAAARAAILAAKREHTTARARASRNAVERADADLQERVSHAVLLEEWGEKLRNALHVFEKRGQDFKADVRAAAGAKRDADQREKQYVATNHAPRAPADAAVAVAAGRPGDQTVAVASTAAVEVTAPRGDPRPPETGSEAPKLGESIIPDLTPKPVAK